MSFFDRFKKKQDKERLAAPRSKPALTPAQAKPKAEEKKERPVVSSEKGKKPERKAPAPAASYQVLIRPLVTEKSVRLANAYAFAVQPTANKRQIAEAIHALYGVKPIGIRVQNYMGKHVRYGRFFGRTKHWKKAVVTVKAGETIQLNENV